MSRERFRRALEQALALDNDLARRARRALDTSEAARKAWITRRAGGAKPPEPAQPRVKAPEPPPEPPAALPPQPKPPGELPPKPENWAQMSPGKKAAWTKAARLLAGLGKPLPKTLAKPPAEPGAKRTAFEAIKSKVTNHVPIENVEKIVGVLDKLNLTGLLEKWPVDAFRFDSMETGSPGINGTYHGAMEGFRHGKKWHPAGGSLLAVKGNFDDPLWQHWDWHRRFRPNASGLAKDRLESRQITLTHELGHHFNATSFNVELYRQQDAAYAHALRTNSLVSEYAKTNKREYFAECWAYYHHFPDILQREDPTGYNLVEQAKQFMATAPVVGLPLAERRKYFYAA